MRKMATRRNAVCSDRVERARRREVATERLLDDDARVLASGRHLLERSMTVANMLGGIAR